MPISGPDCCGSGTEYARGSWTWTWSTSTEMGSGAQVSGSESGTGRYPPSRGKHMHQPAPAKSSSLYLYPAFFRNLKSTMSPDSLISTRRFQKRQLRRMPSSWKKQVIKLKVKGLCFELWYSWLWIFSYINPEAPQPLFLDKKHMWMRGEVKNNKIKASTMCIFPEQLHGKLIVNSLQSRSSFWWKYIV